MVYKSCYISVISIHVPRVEDDQQGNKTNRKLRDFNPRPPCGGRQLLRHSSSRAAVFQSTSPVWRTTALATQLQQCCCISIHVPRVEDDAISGRSTNGCSISIHVPRVEDDHARYTDLPSMRLFQSTSPGWRTTSLKSPSPDITTDFNPRPPCGGRRCKVA